MITSPVPVPAPLSIATSAVGLLPALVREFERRGNHTLAMQGLQNQARRDRQQSEVELARIDAGKAVQLRQCQVKDKNLELEVRSLENAAEAARAEHGIKAAVVSGMLAQLDHLSEENRLRAFDQLIQLCAAQPRERDADSERGGV